MFKYREDNYLKKYSEENYYIPDLVNEQTGQVDEYLLIRDRAILKEILKYTVHDIRAFLGQFPEISSVVFDRIENGYNYANKLGVDPNLCYHYFSSFAGIRKGILLYSSSELEEFQLLFMKMTTNIGDHYQRRIKLFLDLVEESFVPMEVVEVEKNSRIAVQRNFHPRVLKKEKRKIV